MIVLCFIHIFQNIIINFSFLDKRNNCPNFYFVIMFEKVEKYFTMTFYAATNQKLQVTNKKRFFTFKTFFRSNIISTSATEPVLRVRRQTTAFQRSVTFNPFPAFPSSRFQFLKKGRHIDVAEVANFYKINDLIDSY